MTTPIDLLEPREVARLLSEQEITYTWTGWRGEEHTSTEEGWYFWRDFSGPVEVPGLGTVELVQHEGGSEGDGENTHMVFKVSDEFTTRYFRIDGYYASYDGTTWDGDLYEVTPKQKTITVYER